MLLAVGVLSSAVDVSLLAVDILPSAVDVSLRAVDILPSAVDVWLLRLIFCLLRLMFRSNC
ncbi:hypothetical protein GCM10009001_23110 [Virgibacillus siamensis]|uniref:Uncharacterized protein n=1 Tax=Virgibacillus siamensis TaxID=480071 RepID=A0ABN1G717_9BACI